MIPSHKDDIALLARTLPSMPSQWDGKKAILELQERGCDWRRMKWECLYFAALCLDRVQGALSVPGEQYGSAAFDCFRSINWSIRACGLQTDYPYAPLGDVAAIDASIAAHGRHGVMIALMDVKYEKDGAFPRWYAEMEGGMPEHEKSRIERYSLPRYYTPSVRLEEILLLTVDAENKDDLPVLTSGRVADGSSHILKCSLNWEEPDIFMGARISFSGAR